MAWYPDARQRHARLGLRRLMQLVEAALVGNRHAGYDLEERNDRNGRYLVIVTETC